MRYVTAKEIAEKLGITEAEVNERAKREGWPVAGTVSEKTVLKKGRTFKIFTFKKASQEADDDRNAKTDR